MSMSPVYQPVHILRKDAIHLWPETLISIVLLVAYAWAEAQTWLPSNGDFNPAFLAVGFLKFLIPVTWLVLISRLVHDEELVGDRQFWITRPYTWYSLLLSKILFVAVFIGGPFILMQMWLLHHAGLYPLLLIPKLLDNFLHVALIFLLPLFAIAVVTSTFVRYISSALGGFIYAFVIIVIIGICWPESLSTPYVEYLFSLLPVLMLVIAVLLQYWRRKTLIDRLLIATMPLVLLLLAAFAPSNLLTEHRYPNNSIGTASLVPIAAPPTPSGKLMNFRHNVFINLPVQVQLGSLPQDSNVIVQQLRVVLDGPGGVHYTSNWTATNANFSVRRNIAALSFRLPENIFDKIRDKPVALHFQLGTRTYNLGTPYSVNATESPFPLPGHAACTLSSDSGALECRFAFSNPTFQQVQATVHDGTCEAPGQRSAQAFGALEPSSNPMAFSPIEKTDTQLGFGTAKVPLCPGTRITVTPAVEGAYGRMTLDVPSITLDPYAARLQDRNAAPQPPPQQQQ
jgi:hypothetical protein